MSNTVKAKGNIYNLAKLAKERLKQNSYTKVKGNVINTASTFVNYISNQKTSVVTKKVPSKPKCVNHDEELYKKVCFLIETHNTLNPVSYLIDKELFSTLDAEAKQFYINNLTQKYKYMKNRYYREHSGIMYV